MYISVHWWFKGANHGKTKTEKQMDLFADFNGLPDEGAKTEFYQHDANWSNRMILGDSLSVMVSAEITKSNKSC